MATTNSFMEENGNPLLVMGSGAKGAMKFVKEKRKKKEKKKKKNTLQIKIINNNKKNPSTGSLALRRR